MDFDATFACPACGEKVYISLNQSDDEWNINVEPESPGEINSLEQEEIEAESEEQPEEEEGKGEDEEENEEYTKDEFEKKTGMEQIEEMKGAS